MKDILTFKPIQALQHSLDEKADPKTKTWWEAYMKGAILFRGVEMADIRAVLHDWLRIAGIRPGLTGEEQKELAFALFRETYSEDKLAGVLFFAEVLIPQGDVDWREDLPRFAALFQDGYIYE